MQHSVWTCQVLHSNSGPCAMHEARTRSKSTVSMQEAELQLIERETEQAALAQLHEQLRETKHRITEMMHAYHRANSDRDDSQRRMRSASMQLSQHKLIVAHLQRQINRLRSENLRLRGEVQDQSAGRPLQVRCFSASTRAFGGHLMQSCTCMHALGHLP